MAAVVEQVPEGLLRHLVAHQNEATVLLTGAARELPARFEAVDNVAITLLLFVEPSPLPPHGAVVSVQYHHEGKTHVFMTSVLVVVAEPEGCFLSLKRPDRFAHLEARRAFRVPLEPGDLPVELIGPEGRCVGQVRDLSPIGIGVCVAEGELPEVEDSVRVRIVVRNERRVYSGTVVQVTGTTVGVAFTADVPARIGDVVTEAEARWRDRRH